MLIGTNLSYNISLYLRIHSQTQTHNIQLAKSLVRLTVKTQTHPPSHEDGTWLHHVIETKNVPENGFPFIYIYV